MAGLVGPQCKSAGEAIAAASAIAGMKGAPKGMMPKIAVTGVSQVGDMFTASVAVEFVPDPAANNDQPDAKQSDDGRTDTDGDASKTNNNVNDIYALSPTDAQQKALDAGARDTSMLPQDVPDVAPDITPVNQSMEQLPDPDQDLLVAETDNSGPQSSEAVAMAEEMKNEFNDQHDDILVIGNDSTTPEQHASNEAHNQKELDAEETRRERAEANAANAQKEALTPDPVV